jgi:hypothetical protein
MGEGKGFSPWAFNEGKEYDDGCPQPLSLQILQTKNNFVSVSFLKEAPPWALFSCSRLTFSALGRPMTKPDESVQ